MQRNGPTGNIKLALRSQTREERQLRAALLRVMSVFR